MDKKEKSINSHIGKAIGYSDKAHYELQIALNIALEGKGLSDCVWVPTRCSYADRLNDFVTIPNGSIKKLIGRELSWSDEPVELKEE